uniref:Uncharacterized protein n=1 Tax=Eutreptiella gymnastica TaxID=73025 RepID=A0A7S1NK81_9EUGL
MAAHRPQSLGADGHFLCCALLTRLVGLRHIGWSDLRGLSTGSSAAVTPGGYSAGAFCIIAFYLTLLLHASVPLHSWTHEALRQAGPTGQGLWSSLEAWVRRHPWRWLLSHRLRPLNLVLGQPWEDVLAYLWRENQHQLVSLHEAVKAMRDDSFVPETLETLMRCGLSFGPITSSSRRPPSAALPSFSSFRRHQRPPDGLPPPEEGMSPPGRRGRQPCDPAACDSAGSYG